MWPGLQESVMWVQITLSYIFANIFSSECSIPFLSIAEESLLNSAVVVKILLYISINNYEVMTGLMIIWPVTMHLPAKRNIYLGKSNLARQSYCTLSMEKSLSWLKIINVWTIFSPHHKNCYDRTNTKNWWCFCVHIADFPSPITYALGISDGI